MTSDRRLPGHQGGRTIRFEFEGRTLEAREGEPLAVSLLAAGLDVFSRGVKYHRARGPTCMAGRCSNCLMRVDGEPNVFTCVTPVREGMQVERQNAFPSASVDVFRAVDWFYPRGLDHHSLFAGVPLVEVAVAKVAREMAGLGTLPDPSRPAPAITLERHDPDVLVVGAGPAGLAAARVAAEGGARVVIADERAGPGGHLRSGLHPERMDAAGELRAIEAASGRWLRAFVLAAYRDAGGKLLLPARAGRGALHLVRPSLLVVATGALGATPAFGNNDLPGVYTARALARIVSEGVLPGRVALIDGTGPEAVALADLLERSGCEVLGLVGERAPERGKHLSGAIVRARGRSAVAGAIVRGPGGEIRLRCDLIASADRHAPLHDLARQAGAAVRWAPGSESFVVEAAPDGATAAADVLACGEVTGVDGAARAVEAGRRAGRAALERLPA